MTAEIVIIIDKSPSPQLTRIECYYLRMLEAPTTPEVLLSINEKPY